MRQYAVFLRGINLGKRSVKMDELRTSLMTLGFNNPQTLLASGNVLISADQPPDAGAIEIGLAKHFGFEIGVVLRSIEQLETMIASAPFGTKNSGPDVKLYVTMAADPAADRLAGIAPEPGDYELARIDEYDYFCVAFRQEDGRFGAGLDKLEKLFKGTLITTRNWNTILRLVKKAHS